jgi:hypothetical protein
MFFHMIYAKVRWSACPWRRTEHPTAPIILTCLVEFLVRMNAAIRAVILPVVVVFTQKWLLPGKKTGTADLALEFPGMWIDEPGGSVCHGFPDHFRIQLS